MNQSRDVIIVTSCTNRKKKAGTVLVLQQADRVESLCDLASDWKRQVRTVDEDEMQAAGALYAGRSITEAKRAAESLSAPLYIVSAGHGLLRSDERIPSYNVTVSPNSDNELYRCLVRLDKSPAHWWQALIHAVGPQRSLARLMADSPTAVCLLAVPSAYLNLLAHELENLSDEDVTRLRILTSSHGASNLPVRLQAVVMPYDERLEGLPACAGTRSDFPQRALRHFVVVLGAHALPLEDALQQVREAMEALFKPILPKRQRKADEEIIALLRQNWDRFNGSSTALLRYLRDDALVACEQSRFRSLRDHVRTQLNDGYCIHG